MTETRSCTCSPAIDRYAKSKHTWISSGSRNGYSCKIFSGVSPAASIPRTCSTAIRKPLMIGLPLKVRVNLNSIEQFSFGHAETSFSSICGPTTLRPTVSSPHSPWGIAQKVHSRGARKSGPLLAQLLYSSGLCGCNQATLSVPFLFVKQHRAQIC